jgi:Mycothiol maleylpyruvate isomerase N-terminal domain
MNSSFSRSNAVLQNNVDLTDRSTAALTCEEPVSRRSIMTDRIGPVTPLAEQRHFLDVAGRVDPAARVSNTTWTAHDLVAHLVAGAGELLRLLSRRGAGEPVGSTMSFAERELPFRALPYDTLLELAGGGMLQDALRPFAADPSNVLAFTGWDMTAAQILTHIRSELVIHRWDLAGTDDTAIGALSDPLLTVHAVTALSSFDTIGERVEARTGRTGITELDVRLRAEGQPDVRLRIDQSGTRTRLTLESPTDSAALVASPADRLLMLWGRHPNAAPQPTDGNETQELLALARWLRA